MIHNSDGMSKKCNSKSLFFFIFFSHGFAPYIRMSVSAITFMHGGQRYILVYPVVTQYVQLQKLLLKILFVRLFLLLTFHRYRTIYINMIQLCMNETKDVNVTV